MAGELETAVVALVLWDRRSLKNELIKLDIACLLSSFCADLFSGGCFDGGFWGRNGLGVPADGADGRERLRECNSVAEEEMLLRELRFKLFATRTGRASSAVSFKGELFHLREGRFTESKQLYPDDPPIHATFVGRLHGRVNVARQTEDKIRIIITDRTKSLASRDIFLWIHCLALRVRIGDVL